MSEPAPVRTLDGAEAAAFRPAGAAYEPVVLRGVAGHWPLVSAARESDSAVLDALRAMDGGGAAETFLAPPEAKGRFFYAEGMQGFNFGRGPQTLSRLADALETASGLDRPPTLYMGSAPAASVAPRFAAAHPLPSPPQGVEPRLWVGNATTVSAHFDLSDNIAVVAAGRRRFTLFPPDQAANLYVGPLDHTPAGQPISTVDIVAPDLERHPRYAEALKTARVAELEPGDAIYIPSPWWHHVRARGHVNVLVNYWWDPAPAGVGSPFEAMVHGLWAIRELAPERRAAFRALFDHFVFQTGGDPVAHLPEQGRGILGEPTPDLRARIRAFLARGLNRPG